MQPISNSGVGGSVLPQEYSGVGGKELPQVTVAVRIVIIIVFMCFVSIVKFLATRFYQISLPMSSEKFKSGDKKTLTSVVPMRGVRVLP